MGSTNENVWGAFPNFSRFIVTSRRKILPHGANNNGSELTKNEKPTTSKQCQSELQRNQRMPNFPKFSRTLGQFVIVWQGLYCKMFVMLEMRLPIHVISSYLSLFRTKPHQVHPIWPIFPEKSVKQNIWITQTGIIKCTYCNSKSWNNEFFVITVISDQASSFAVEWSPGLNGLDNDFSKH